MVRILLYSLQSDEATTKVIGTWKYLSNLEYKFNRLMYFWLISKVIDYNSSMIVNTIVEVKSKHYSTF